MGKSSINGPFSMAMLNNQRVNFFQLILELSPLLISSFVFVNSEWIHC